MKAAVLIFSSVWVPEPARCAVWASIQLVCTQVAVMPSGNSSTPHFLQVRLRRLAKWSKVREMALRRKESLA